jgi:Holliday junction resolvase RusA-like endonuclease
MNEIYLVNFMEVLSPMTTGISFVMVGDPPTQQRHKMAFGRAPAAQWRRMRPHMYDPSARSKIHYASNVRMSLNEFGLTRPYFNEQEPLFLEVLFVLPRRRQDLVRRNGFNVLTATAQAFPRNKDIDNMLKYLMDALQGELYANDVTITKVMVTKMFALNLEVNRGWTEVKISTSSVVPPLATGVFV